MRKILFLCLLPVVSLAQNITYSGGSCDNNRIKLSPQEKIDTCLFECIYLHTTTDPKHDVFQTERYEILQIGEVFSKYSEYGRYRLDSVLSCRDISKIRKAEYAEMYSRYKPKSDLLIREIGSDKLVVYNRVFIDNYTYTDSLHDLNWQLSDETKTVCGQQCRKATCDFRGRKWSAWYCDLPIACGPWKFSGLPGLILEVEDSTKEHFISAISVRKAHSTIMETKKNYLRTTREKFNRTLDYYMKNSGKVISGSVAAPKNRDGSPKRLPNRKRFFNPMERE